MNMSDLEKEINHTIEKIAVAWTENKYSQKWHIEQANFENLMIDIRELVKEREQAAAEKAVREYSEKVKDLVVTTTPVPMRGRGWMVKPEEFLDSLDQLLKAELGEGK